MRLILSLLYFTLLCLECSAQQSLGQRAFSLLRVVQKYHIEPRPINDSFSQQVYRYMLADADPYGVYLSAADRAQLEPYRYRIDDEILARKDQFAGRFFELYLRGMRRYRAGALTILKQPFSFESPGFFAISTKEPRAVPEQALPAHWQGYLKWSLLYNWWQQTDSTALAADFVRSHEAEARKRRMETIQKEMANAAEDSALWRHDIEDLYLNAIAYAFDPHTAFFCSVGKASYDEELSSEYLGFGFAVSPDEEGNLVVDEIVPGGSAWKSNALFAGNRIVAIKPEGSREALLLKDLSPGKLSELLKKAESRPVEFTVQAADRTTRVVKLKQEPIRNEENITRGWVINGEQRVGYLSLPAFYMPMDNGVGTSCAEDMALEIVNLKKEGIKGLVLDLRYNGGGSMDEAADLLSIFVDIGPLGMVKLYDGSTELVKDMNRGRIWDGPMVVLVNGASASASELVAGTLQDYGAALVAGSPTYGKATMQVMLPLDTNYNPNAKPSRKSPYADETGDFVKVTIGRFYRVSGRSAQLQGVKPDVELPDMFEASGMSERSEPTALKADSLAARPAYRPTMPWFSWHTVAGFADTAIRNDAGLQAIRNMVGAQPHETDTDTIPLSLAAFNAYMKQYDPPANVNSQGGTPIQVLNTRTDARLNELDSYHREMDESIRKNIADDLYIIKACQLLQTILSNQTFKTP